MSHQTFLEKPLTPRAFLGDGDEGMRGETKIPLFRGGLLVREKEKKA
jgi:hypothetical protein